MNVLVAPILAPVLVAALLAVGLRRIRLVGLLGPAVQLLAGVVLLAVTATGETVCLQLGAWPSPFGISLVGDALAAILVTLTGGIGLVIGLYSLAEPRRGETDAIWWTLFNLLLAGVAGAFLTGDMFNLYVWFEVLLTASFVLLALDGKREQMAGGLIYVTLNLLSSAVFLAAVGILYGKTGSLNLAELSVRVPVELPSGLAGTLAMMFLVAFGIKAALFPLFFWLPASYHTPAPAVSALFAGLLTKVGVYSLARIFALLFPPAATGCHALLLGVGMATAVVGVLGAVAQVEVRRVLAFHSISQVGYMVMGIGLFSLTSLTAAVVFMVHHSVVKAGLFLVGGVIERLRGSGRLYHVGGLYRTRPGLAVMFLLLALSLAGLPPLSGFVAKLGLVQAGILAGDGLAVTVALAVGLLTLMSMTKIWAEAFWAPDPADPPRPADGGPIPVPELVGIVILAAGAVLLGLAAEPFWAVSEVAAGNLLDPAAYRAAVIGGGG